VNLDPIGNLPNGIDILGLPKGKGLGNIMGSDTLVSQDAEIPTEIFY
jgi:hypothetical protein